VERSEFLEQLIETYQVYFDVSHEPKLTGLPIVAEAEFHSHGEKYLLVKSAKLWGADTNEYLFFVSVDHLTLPLWRQLQDAVWAEGLSRVTPHNEHMYSYVSIMLVADRIDDDARRAIGRVRLHKSFRLSLQGWADFRVAALELTSGNMVGNRMGKPMLVNFKNLLSQ
jgi:hypothetical protein